MKTTDSSLIRVFVAGRGCAHRVIPHRGCTGMADPEHLDAGCDSGDQNEDGDRGGQRCRERPVPLGTDVLNRQQDRGDQK